jgi:O-antigen/teichoic acid export membrane protein
VFGSQYAPSIVPLRLLLGSLIFGFLALITGALLNATNNQKTQTSLITVVLVFNIILNLLLLPRFGIVGAAIAALCSNMLLCFAGLYFSVRSVSIDMSRIGLYLNQTLWPAVGMALVAYGLSFKLHYILVIAISGALYVALLFATRVLSVEVVKLVLRKVRLLK